MSSAPSTSTVGIQPQTGSTPVTTLKPASGMVLTVGANGEFATLADACKAAVNGDTIAVQAGTYVNDFAIVNANISIVAVGGVVNEVATEPPPNDKGLITVNANLNIQGFTFTGGSDGSPDGNVAGIRLQAGNLNVSYCYFHDMQEGLLAGPDPTATVNISHSEFAYNGTGDGYSHNLYVGAVAKLTVTNSYFIGANVGHEIKSRAAVTNISNNVIVDGATGTGSYDIDVPNGGVATISNNIIEKGPDASNTPAIHYGGEGQYSYTNNALTVSNNVILDDLANGSGVAVFNQSYVNGLTLAANITGNSFYNFAPGNIVLGLGNVSNSTTLTTEPSIVTPPPYLALPTTQLASNGELLTLVNSNHTITGNGTLLTLNDKAGSNTISGGAGGMNLSVQAGWDQISTKAGSSNTVKLTGSYNTLQSAGTDHITTSGEYEAVTVTGAATITNSNFSGFTLDGKGETLTSSSDCVANIGAAGQASVIDQGGDIQFSVASGGTLKTKTTAGTLVSTATISGGAATGWITHGGTLSIATGESGANVKAGTGSVTVTGGSGNDTLTAGSGTDDFVLGNGCDQINFGTGSASVTGGTGVDIYNFTSGDHANVAITGFKVGTDMLNFTGFSGQAVSSGTISDGSTLLTLADGTIIDLLGAVLPSLIPNTATASSPALSATSTAQPSAPAMSLTNSGHLVQGATDSLTVDDYAGGNTIIGGAGGMSLHASDADHISTKAGSTNQITLARYDSLVGAGNDQVVASEYANSISESGAATVILLGGANNVTGGAGLLQITDMVGGDTIKGGAGGIDAALPTWYDVVTTNAEATDNVTMAGYGTLTSAGTDAITLTGNYNTALITGTSNITANSGSDSLTLDGQDTLSMQADGLITVGGSANVAINSAGASNFTVSLQAGGHLSLTDSLPGGAATLNLGGGAATVTAATGIYSGLSAALGNGAVLNLGLGAISVTGAAAGQTDTISGGAGQVTLNGGAGNDNFIGGSGTAQLNLGSGNDTVVLGSGDITVSGGVNDIFQLPATATGSMTITGWNSHDSFVTSGGVPASFANITENNGSTLLTTSSGAQITLVGVSQFH